jgi:hypothetical protein
VAKDIEPFLRKKLPVVDGDKMNSLEHQEVALDALHPQEQLLSGIIGVVVRVSHHFESRSVFVLLDSLRKPPEAMAMLEAVEPGGRDLVRAFRIVGGKPRTGRKEKKCKKEPEDRRSHGILSSGPGRGDQDESIGSQNPESVSDREDRCRSSVGIGLPRVDDRLAGASGETHGGEIGRGAVSLVRDPEIAVLGKGGGDGLVDP